MGQDHAKYCGIFLRQEFSLIIKNRQRHGNVTFEEVRLVEVTLCEMLGNAHATSTHVPQQKTFIFP